VRGQPIAAGDLQAFVDGQVARALSTDHVAGVVVSVVQNGQLVMEKGYGRASLDPAKAMDPRATLVRLGSASQTFTWIAALKAVEEGKLDLSKPVNAYLPETLRLPDEGFRQQVTVSQLMSRTAGFEDRRFGRRYTRDASRIEALEAALQDQRPRRVREAGLVSIPSDYGAALAGEIVARVEGKPFDQLIETEILRPLGLNHTSFREPYPAAQGLPDPLSETLANQLGTEFHWTGHGLEPQPFAYGESLAPAIAASTTADDMARLMIALLNNGALGDASLYGPRTAALLAQPLQAPAPGAAGSAHGLMSMTLPGAGRTLFERGAGAASHSELLLIPGMNLGVFVAANTDSGAALVASLPSTLAEHFAAAAPQSGWTAPADWSAGTYLSANRASHGLEAFVDRLIFVTHLGSDGAGGLILKDARTTQHFAHTDTDGLYAGPEGQTLYLPGGAADRPPVYLLGSGLGAGERIGGVHSLVVLTVAAALVAIAIFTNLASLFIRDHTDQRQTNHQIAAAITQGLTCVVWSLAFVGFGLFLKNAADPQRFLFGWPDGWLVAASACALAAALLSVVMLVQVPGVWREERRRHGWSVWRKFRHTVTIFLFLGFSVILAAWGALEPWSS
jgi:CubicO group peptidase (beta-lactamase class C family)